MPLYEWRCQDCGTKFEVLTTYEQSLGPMVCTSCKGSNVRKLLPLIARRTKSGDDFGDDFGSGEDMGDFGDDGEDDLGGCSCGGACSCNN